MKTKTISYGTIKLTPSKDNSPYVPKHADPIELPMQSKKSIALAISEYMPCLLTGETGLGKTSAIRYIAKLLNRPYVRVNLTGHITPDELIGSKSARDGSTYFEEGSVITAMREGAILVVDELNACPPDTTFIFHSLLDDDRSIRLPNGEVITPHKDFRFFATMNPDYEGTKTLNRAFYDRFPLVVEFDIPTPATELKILLRHIKDKNTAYNMIQFANMTRKNYHENQCMAFISTRSLIQWANLIDKLDIYPAFQQTILSKIAKEEKQAILDLYNATFKTDKTNSKNDELEIVTKKQIKEYTDTIDKLKQTNVLLEEKEKSLDQKIQITTRDLVNLKQSYIDQGKKLKTNEKTVQDQQKQIESFETIKKAISQYARES